MKLFVTGGTGFIGSHFLRLAAERHYPVISLRRSPFHIVPLADDSITWVEGDLESCPRRALEGCDTFVHLAAHGVAAPTIDWAGCFRWNVDATLNLLLTACQAGIKRFVVCGSCFEYGRSTEHYDAVPATAPLLPVGPYAASKAAATMAALALAQQENVQLLILRPFHTFGEGERPARFWPALRQAALSGQDLPMTAGEQVRDFTPVAVVAEAFADAVGRSDLVPGHPWIENVGTGVPSTLRQFAEHWWKQWQAPGRLLFGAIPYRDHEVMRYVPELPRRTKGP